MTDVVLVVEGDCTLRNKIVQRLHLAGFAPIAASSWPDALDVVRLGIAIELIFFGPKVPRDAGWGERLAPHIPVVMLPPDPWPALDQLAARRRIGGGDAPAVIGFDPQGPSGA